MKRLALVLVACGSQPPAPAPAKPEPVAKKPAADLPDRPIQLPPRGSANDDLPHTRERLAPVFAGAKTCIPTIPDEDDMHKLEIGLDAYDNHLVACADVPTRRGESVFFDIVSYACWNVEPATGKLERRTDLARSYFECHDGDCHDTNHAISHDGKTTVTFDPAAMTVAITQRDGGAARTIPAPKELEGADLVRGWLVYTGHAIFARGDAGFVAFDDSGKVFGTAPGLEAQILDDAHVLVVDDAPPADPEAAPAPIAATLFDLTARKTSKVSLSEPALARAVYFGGKSYAVAGRRLLELDPKTFAVKTNHALAICP